MLTLFANELAFNVGVLALHRRVLTLSANETGGKTTRQRCLAAFVVPNRYALPGHSIETDSPSH